MTTYTAHFTPHPTNPDAVADTVHYDISDHINNLDERERHAIDETIARNGRWWDNIGETGVAATTPAFVANWVGDYDLYITCDDNADIYTRNIHRTTIEIVVYSDGPYVPQRLGDIDYDINDGPHIGDWDITSSVQVADNDIEQHLTAIGNAGTFFGPDPSWDDDDS